MVKMQSVVVLRNCQNFKSDLRDIKLRTKCTKRFGTGFFYRTFWQSDSTYNDTKGNFHYACHAHYIYFFTYTSLFR